ncbi:YjbH domain-containing protein [candidate division KSB1 bacterium]|nr:YjbH domain-containing protein [candidate division KSB1 bacterium]
MRTAITTSVLAFLALAPFTMQAQSLSGMPGLVHVPTADFMRDGAFYVGGSYLPRQTLGYSNFDRDGLALFSSLTFMPFIEVDLRFTKQLGRSAAQGHTVDRSPSVRFKLLREKRARPAVVFGIHDVFSTVAEGGARHFGATYVVLSKRFMSSQFLVATSMGYGFVAFESRGRELIGLFGGVKFRSIHFRRIALLAEYDTKYINVGADFYVNEIVRCKCGLLNFQYFTANASMHFNLFDVF